MKKVKYVGWHRIWGAAPNLGGGTEFGAGTNLVSSEIGMVARDFLEKKMGK